MVPYLGNVIIPTVTQSIIFQRGHPNWRSQSFFRGVAQPKKQDINSSGFIENHVVDANTGYWFTFLGSSNGASGRYFQDPRSGQGSGSWWLQQEQVGLGGDVAMMVTRPKIPEIHRKGKKNLRKSWFIISTTKRIFSRYNQGELLMIWLYMAI